MSEEIPEISWIEIDADFPTCPHCGRYCGDVYMDDPDMEEYLEMTEIRDQYDYYYEVQYQSWISIITCPDCGGKFQFEDANA